MSFEQSFADAYEQRLFGPGISLLASNTDGSFSYEKSFGVRSWKEGEPQKPFDTNTFVRLASCTKLLGSIAVLQCVERGLLDLDADIGAVIPELKNKPVASLDDNGEVVQRPSTKPNTLRLLLSHQGGTAYSYLSPAYQKLGLKPADALMYDSPSVASFADWPLSSEPGTLFEYGLGIDWAAYAVPLVTGQTLEEFMKQHIFSPLDISGITFWPWKHPELAADLADACVRDPASELAVHNENVIFTGAVKEEMPGAQGFARVSDYFKVLQSLLRDDGRLLRPETSRLLFEPQLSASSRERLMYMGTLGLGIEGHVDVSKCGLDHGLAGVVCVEDVPGFKCKGSLHWGGYPNLTWFVDRRQGLCGFVAAQMYPTGDRKMIELDGGFARGVYALHNEWKKGRE